MVLDIKRSAVEWVGGLVRVPAYVSGESEPYRPDVLFWMDVDGRVLSSRVAKPGELLESVASSLHETIVQPQFGRAHRPTRIRVATPELAERIRGAFPDIELVCAATPEIDALAVLMRERFEEDAAREQSYLLGVSSVDAIGAFFRAAASLFRAAPWRCIPSDQDLFTVSIEQLGLRDAVLSVIGQLGQSVGWILFANYSDFEAYSDAGATCSQAGMPPTLPPHFALNFERGAELGVNLRKEIVRHGWEVAGAEAYPWLMAMDEDLVARPPTAAELAGAEAMALALPRFMAQDRPAVLQAWSAGPACTRTLSVTTHVGQLTVTLRATHRRELEHTRARSAFFELAGSSALNEQASPAE
ncbi:MAG: hypothetical protein RL701_7673 [Pseudomonadota bacterium]